jgi:hypothetical protein
LVLFLFYNKKIRLSGPFYFLNSKAYKSSRH